MNTMQRLPLRKLAARTALVLGMAVLATSPQTAQAQSASDFGVASDFDLFIFGNVEQTDAFVEGGAAIGGSAGLTRFDVGEKLSNPDGLRDGLIVGDSLNYQKGNVWNGNLRVGGYAELGPKFAIHNGRFKPGNPIDFDAVEQGLLAQSGEWSGLAPDGTVTMEGSAITLKGKATLAGLSATATVAVGGSAITLTGVKQTLNVFNVSGADVSGAAHINIDAPVGSTVLVNISGTTVGMSAVSFSLNGVDAQHVLYHFHAATTLTLETNGIEGTVFAPRAGVMMAKSSVNGQLIAASLTGTGQVHRLPFEGTVGGSAGGGQNLPVELTAFEAVLNGQQAQITWKTAAELNNAGFEILHATGDGPFQRLAFVEGHGTTLEAQRYSYTTRTLTPGTHRFRLKQIDLDGAHRQSNIVEVAVAMPDAFEVEPAYPNPFNPQTNLRFRVREAQHVTVSLYNTLGQRVRVLQEGMVQADQPQDVRIDGSSLASGTYLVRIAGASFAKTQRIVLIK